jgi:hypothetical protein
LVVPLEAMKFYGNACVIVAVIVISVQKIVCTVQLSPSCNFVLQTVVNQFNPLNAELNPICYLLALLGAY